MLSSFCRSRFGRNEPVILLRTMNVLKPEITDLTLPNEIGSSAGRKTLYVPNSALKICVMNLDAGSPPLSPERSFLNGC
jgi:hypothetical protein